MTLPEFETGMLEEFEWFLQRIEERRKVIVGGQDEIQSFMGHAFALGALDSVLWRLIERTKRGLTE